MNGAAWFFGTAVEVHATIVGGFITGVVLLAALILSESLIRQRERRIGLEHAVHRLTHAGTDSPGI